MFVLSATKNQLAVSQGEQITSGSVNVYPVKFIFSSDWDGMDRVAVFRVGNERTSVLLTDEGECQIPWEAMQSNDEGKHLYAGVYGTIGGEVVLPTVWTSLGTIREGTRLGGSALPPTPNLIDQALQQVEAAAERAENAAIHQPIIQDGTWWTWNPETGEYEDTGTAATGGGTGGTGNVSSDEIRAIRVLDQAEYDALTEKSPTTLYLIRG